MANIVKFPYSNTAGNTPDSLQNGQLGVQQADGKLYYRNSSGVVTLFTSAASLADGYVFDCGAYTATWLSQNATWTAIGFSGSGTAASPYAKTSYATNFVTAQATVVSSGTVRITGTLYSDFGIDVYKNGSVAYTIPDANGGNGGTYTVNATITVAAGDVIRFGASGDYYTITSLNVWWQ